MAAHERLLGVNATWRNQRAALYINLGPVSTRRHRSQLIKASPISQLSFPERARAVGAIEPPVRTRTDANRREPTRGSIRRRAIELGS